MHIPDGTLERLLVQSKYLSKEDVNTLRQESVRSRIPLQKAILDNKKIDEITLTKLFAEYTDTPYVEVNPEKSPPRV